MITPASPHKKTWFPAFEPEVDHALFLLGYRNLKSSGLGQIVGPCLVALATYEHAPALALSLWLGFSVLVGLFYFVLLWYFRSCVYQTEPDKKAIRRWLRYRHALQFVSSIGWGAMSFLMQPQATVHNAFILVVFTAIVGQSAFSNLANDFLGSVASAAVTCGIFISHLPYIFGESIWVIVMIYVLFALALLAAMRNTQAMLRDAIRLRLDNEKLARNNAEQARRADQANRDKSEFLAAASHDLRQPVHALLLLVEAYRQQVPAAMDHPLMQHITQAGQSINGLFNALMELSRLESGTEKPVLVDFMLAEVMQEVAKRSLPEAHQ
ncbi:MAG: response regulator receiver, partial [Comamonadaceae bacterium]